MLQRSLDRKAQIFLFVSRIAHIEGLLQLLRRMFPGISIEGTSSQDPGRAEKVLKFRDRTISLLVTTTILERGVTVPHSDVFILDADSGLFDEAALVQMAGRAGRSRMIRQATSSLLQQSGAAHSAPPYRRSAV